MADLKDVLQDNRWSSASLQQSTAVKKLIQGGIIAPVRGAVKQVIDGLDSDNMQSKITAGIIMRTFAEPDNMDASDDEIKSHGASQNEFDIKTFYQAHAEIERSIQEDIMPMSVADAKLHLINVYGEYWAEHWNNLVAYTIKGMTDISDINAGTDGSKNFSKQMVLDVRKQKGDRGFGRLGKFYMNSTTLHDILTKQEAGTIAQGTIVETYGFTTIEVNGVATQVQDVEPTFKFNGVTPIEVDDALSDGLIAVLDKASFLIGERAMKNPFEIARNAKSGKGSGVSELITRKTFILHPAGFNFVGTLGTDFASKSGVSYAELEVGGLYDIATDPKQCGVSILKVKIG